MTRLKPLIPSLAALALGLSGVLFVLFAWQLPPFDSPVARTENAYVKGAITTISPQLSGYVAEVPVADFQHVERGDVVVRLDDRQYRQKMAQAEAALDAARAQLANNAQRVHSAEAALRARKAAQAAAEASLASARSDWERISVLNEKGIIASSEADKTELSLRQAEASLDQAESQVAVAQEDVRSAGVAAQALRAAVAQTEAVVELARLDLENTIIRAPETGTLGQVSAQVGQYVGAGSALVSEVSEQVWVVANFRETELKGMHVGQPVSFFVDALEGRSFTGRIERFAPATTSEFSVLAGSNATGNFTKIAQRLPVRIAIDPGQPGSDTLAPGLSVVVKIDTRT
ncbi:HlyD family secretion protein [Qingshengfaniella alkalisoli]|uniref:HlyD family secretion protein n=1 Tax=Qingshengfaniella alkalisoli TaxID=2599296 RepID=A0A5B8IZJ5_9RHOB|nr:HlyD family secretion protein [Qingshengfaniella alkalisoli]QDY70038.1 HlyD family secretion protein [Qingshengfaniella alkalisoli]